MSNSTIAENAEMGIHAGLRASVRGSTIRDNATYGIYAFRWKRSDDQSRPVGGIKIKGSTVSGNDLGLLGNKVFVVDSVVTGNMRRGVEANSLSARGANDLRGNAFDPGCGATEECVDAATTKKPSGLDSVNCGTSRRLLDLPTLGLTPESWRVCAFD